MSRGEAYKGYITDRKAWNSASVTPETTRGVASLEPASSRCLPAGSSYNCKNSGDSQNRNCGSLKSAPSTSRTAQWSPRFRKEGYLPGTQRKQGSTAHSSATPQVLVAVELMRFLGVWGGDRCFPPFAFVRPHVRGRAAPLLILSSPSSSRVRKRRKPLRC